MEDTSKTLKLTDDELDILIGWYCSIECEFGKTGDDETKLQERLKELRESSY